MVSPTSYPEVNQVLDQLLQNTKAILGQEFVGLYLYGSLASGDFDPATSDVDFLIVTQNELSDYIVSALEAMHQRLWANGNKWASKLEGSYISKQVIRHHDPASPPCPTVNEGKFFCDRRGSDWIIQRYILYEQGVEMEGPPLKSLIDPVSRAEVRRAVVLLLEEWWEPMLENPTWLNERGDEYQVYTVLSMCRALYTLQNRDIASKPVSAHWVLTEVDEQWKSMVEDALAWRPGTVWKYSGSKTLEFIRFTVEHK